MTTQQHQIHASALNRVVACNGSIAQSRMSEVPQDREQTDDQREGDAAHFVAMDVLRGVISDPTEYVDRKMPNGVYVTAEMAEAVTPFVEAVRQELADGAEMFIERPADYDISPSVRILARPDVVTWNPFTQVLSVHDFKYGWRIVEPRDNWTLTAYVRSAIEMIDGQVPHTVRRVIYQPRSHHEDGKIREYVTTFDEWQAEHWQLASKLTPITDLLHTGKHCYKCPALANCRAARDAGYNAIDISHEVFNDKLSDPELEIERVEIIRAIERLEQRRDAVTELMLHRISEGAIYQNHYVERPQGHAKFNAGVSAATIKAISGIDITKAAMVTPAQAVRLGVPESVVKAFSSRPTLPPKLVNKSAAERAAKMFDKT